MAASLPRRAAAAIPEGRTGRRVWNELLVEARYDGYLQREAAEIGRMRKLEVLSIPEDFDYSTVRGLAGEARQKLERGSSDHPGPGRTDRRE